MRKSIALLCNSAWAMFNFRKEIIAHLIQQRHRVVIVAPSDASFAALAEMGAECLEWKLEARGTNPLEELRAVGMLKRVLSTANVDLIIGYTIKPAFYGSLVSSMLKLPMIALVTGLGHVFLGDSAKTAVIRAMYRVALKNARAILFLNNDDRDLFLEGHFATEGQALVMPGEGIDTAHFAPVAPRPGNGKFRFLMISRLLAEKGVTDYCEAARQLRADNKDCECVLAGNYDKNEQGAVPEALIEEMKSTGLVDYAGKVDDIRALIAVSDCVVLPSYREGLPRSLLEAASMGKPLIATNVPGCREIVRDGWNGYLCEAGNPTDLARAMCKIMDSTQEHRLAMGVHGRALAIEKFEMARVIDFYDTILADYLR